MRFGIQSVNFNNVIEQMKDPYNILNILKFDFTNIVLDAVKCGYRHIELTLDMATFYLEDFEKKILKNY